MPASGDVLLDTSVIIPYFRGEIAVRAQFHAGFRLYLPLPALGELNCGAHLSSNSTHGLLGIRNFLSAVIVLSPGTATAEHYGRLRAQLASVGTPIPENDIWIAALAIEHQMSLAARDVHFDRIIGLQVLKW
jgi:tRNA(fMet)-specific endonuclease VapC